MSAPTWQQLRGRVAGLSRDRSPDDPELVTARRDLAVARLAEQIGNVVAEHGPLPQTNRLTLLEALWAGEQR